MNRRAVPAEELPADVLAKLGISLEDNGNQPKRRPAMKLSALGKVLQAIGSLKKDDATWCLTEAMSYVRKKEGPASDTATVIRVTARFFKVTPAEIIGRRRTETVVRARQMVMFLLWQTSRYTLAQVGEAVGGRSPATISHAFQKVSKGIVNDMEVADEVNRITDELKLIGGDW